MHTAADHVTPGQLNVYLKVLNVVPLPTFQWGDFITEPDSDDYLMGQRSHRCETIPTFSLYARFLHSQLPDRRLHGNAVGLWLVVFRLP